MYELDSLCDHKVPDCIITDVVKSINDQLKDGQLISRIIRIFEGAVDNTAPSGYISSPEALNNWVRNRQLRDKLRQIWISRSGSLIERLINNKAGDETLKLAHRYQEILRQLGYSEDLSGGLNCELNSNLVELYLEELAVISKTLQMHLVVLSRYQNSIYSAARRRSRH